jgi:hypothetical protein
VSDSRKISCGVHGWQDQTFVCQHIAESLRTGIPVGISGRLSKLTPVLMHGARPVKGSGLRREATTGLPKLRRSLRSSCFAARATTTPNPFGPTGARLPSNTSELLTSRLVSLPQVLISALTGKVGISTCASSCLDRGESAKRPTMSAMIGKKWRHPSERLPAVFAWPQSESPSRPTDEQNPTDNEERHDGGRKVQTHL